MNRRIGPDLTGTCFRCGERKPAGEFYADRSKASGRKSICKACDRAKGRAYYAQNAERVIARVKRHGKNSG